MKNLYQRNLLERICVVFESLIFVPKMKIEFEMVLKNVDGGSYL